MLRVHLDYNRQDKSCLDKVFDTHPSCAYNKLYICTVFDAFLICLKSSWSKTLRIQFK